MSKEEVKTERHTETKEEAIKNMRKIVEVEEENHVETKEEAVKRVAEPLSVTIEKAKKDINTAVIMAERNEKFNKNRGEKREDNTPHRLIAINRVTKVVKGGRRMRFTALVVVGDEKGSVGIGTGKAAEVPEAIKKAVEAAKRDVKPVAVVGTTIPHRAEGVYGRGRVLLMPAEEGTGVIAGGPVRAVLEMAGIKDIRTKSIGTTTPINCVRATINGLRQLRTAEEIMEVRNIGKADDEKIVL